MGSGESSASGSGSEVTRLRGVSTPSTIQEAGPGGRPGTPQPSAVSAAGGAAAAAGAGGGGSIKRWNTIGIGSGRRPPFAPNRPPLTHQATMSGALITLAGAQANAREGERSGKATVAVIRRRSGGELPFAVRSIGVYCGEQSDRYTVQHMVGHVEPEAAAAGLREGDLITHIDGESVAGLLHTQLVRRLCSTSTSEAAGELRVTTVPIERLGIRRGARRRAAAMSRLVTPSHTGSTSLRIQTSHRAPGGGGSGRVSSPAPSGSGPSFARKYEPRKKGALASSLLRRVSQKRAVVATPPPPLSRLACPGPVSPSTSSTSSSSVGGPSALTSTSVSTSASASAAQSVAQSSVQSAVVLLASSPSGKRLYSREELSSTGSSDSPAPASPLLVSTTSSISNPDSPLLVSVVGAARRLQLQASASTSSGGEWSQSGSGDFSPANSAFGSPVVRQRTASGASASGHPFHQATSPLAFPTPSQSTGSRGSIGAASSPFCYTGATAASGAGVPLSECKPQGAETMPEISMEHRHLSISHPSATIPKIVDSSDGVGSTCATTRPPDAPPRPPSTLALAPPTYHHHHHHHHSHHQRPLPSPLGLSTQTNADPVFVAGAVPPVPPTPLVRRRSLQSPQFRLNYSHSSGTLKLEITREETKSTQERTQINK